MRNRGYRNTNDRGSSKARKARKLWLLTKFGDGTTAPCSEPDCDIMVDITTIFVDRITPRYLGGTYRRDNIRPHCKGCSGRQGARIRLELKRLREAA